MTGDSILGFLFLITIEAAMLQFRVLQRAHSAREQLKITRDINTFFHLPGIDMNHSDAKCTGHH